ncbi:hypothetical protein PL321_17700 [Caloramator sp. mosi_1]|uniref:hypothetical protein n=1 Tax=Caloramator sp. mosi_1 TaxID=3023090 RepID=UPI00235DE79A|nr:hypothetical protein [Caloramator sp. mosi_1]WDC84094.1 hypothetical protein PL321_17700 [Caloramator sp. mosi_1]
MKSGAEKLCSLLNLSVQIDILDKVEDFKEGIFHYVCKCTLKNSFGNVVSEGLGSCNSKESKFSNQNPFAVANTVLKLSKKSTCGCYINSNQDIWYVYSGYRGDG